LTLRAPVKSLDLGGALAPKDGPYGATTT
jgi:hypothetical protein